MKFMCSKCFKNLSVGDGQGLIKVRCPYCSGIIEVYTGESVSEETSTYISDISASPIEVVRLIKDFKFSELVNYLKNSSFSVGEEVIISFWNNVGYDNELVATEKYPGKITKWKVCGTSLFRGPNFEIQIILMNGKTITVSSGDTDRSFPQKKFIFNPPHYEPTEIRIEKYHPTIYRQECSESIDFNNKNGIRYP